MSIPVETEIFREPWDTEMTPELLADYIGKHNRQIATRYSRLDKAYKNRYAILGADKKPAWKPDNRIPVNFAK